MAIGNGETTDNETVIYQNTNNDFEQDKVKKYLGNIGAAYRNEIICGAKGLYAYTSSGHRFLDWTSGQMSCLLGHGHPEIVKVVSEHAAGLDHLFTGMVSPPVASLAARLCTMLPPGLDKAFFLSTGGESYEAAIKLAKTYTGNVEVVGLGASWHGMTAQALGA